ncbi:MAG: NAD-dependent epimerase/dehydratase family protein [Hyphomicrobiaceae bacterium]
MRILLAGGSGFIGAWIARRLLARGDDVVVFDVAGKPKVFDVIVGAAASRITWISGDIVDGEGVLAAARGCDGIINLAGLLTPACQADPVRGAKVNLLGTLNTFEAAVRLGIRRNVYTSSAGVFGPGDGRVPRPVTHYGAFKLACEGSARAYLADHGVPSVGFRPFIVYGPGREIGLTAGPSLACRAAALGERYVIPYTGSGGLVYVDDVAAAYERALTMAPDGAHVFNLVGELASNEDVIAAIRTVVPDAQLSVEGPDMRIAADVDEGDLAEVMPGLPRTTLADGVAETIAFYRQHGRP